MSPQKLPAELIRGPFGVDDAYAIGLNRGRLRRQDLIRRFRGVYTLSSTSDTLIARCHALRLKMRPGWVFSGITAARLYGIPVPRRWHPDEGVHVLALGGSNVPRLEGVVGTRSGIPLQTRVLFGLPILAPADAWTTLVEMLELTDLVAAGDRIVGMHEPLGTMEEITAAIRLVAGRRGAKKLREAEALILPGARSPRETRLRLMLDRAGVPFGRPNGLVQMRDGKCYFGDLVVDQYRVIFEYDGDQHRSDDYQWAHDVRRLNALAAEGWLVVRFTRHHSPREVIELARTALRSRGWRP